VLLSDRDIRAEIAAGRVGCEPFHEAMIQPSSVDVRLDKFFRVFENHKYSVIDPSIEQPELTREVVADGEEPFILHPGEFVLASTYEVITLPDDIAGRLEGKSSLGRLGLLTHTAPRALSTQALADTSLLSFQTLPTCRSNYLPE
jgi:dCTP deaminase